MQPLARVQDYLEVNLVQPLRRRPDRDGWRWIGLSAAYGAVALTIVLGTGLLQLGTPPLWELFVFPLLLILYPSLIEECVFRGLFMPQSLASQPAKRQVFVVVGSTALFVAMHPLNHWLIGLSDTSAFTDPVFLVIVALLGLTCAMQRLKTGSLWLPVLTHWATVVVWNLFFGRDLSF